MKPVAAATSHRIIKRKLQIVVAQEPVECRPGLVAPAAITCYAVRLQIRRYRAGSLKWLLIKARLLATLAIKTLRPDRHKVAIAFRALRCSEPVQRFEARGDHAIIRAS